VSLSLIDKFVRPPSGRLFYQVFERGKLIETVDDHNLIVVGSQSIHAHLLGGAVTNQSVTQIGYGTNGTAPVFGNTALTGAYTKAIDSVAYPATNQVQFNFSLGVGGTDTGAYGLAISEFGLLTPSGTLYARKTRSAPLNFNSDISFTGAWTISF
jgi:Flp pilus assembly protein TadG